MWLNLVAINELTLVNIIGSKRANIIFFHLKVLVNKDLKTEKLTKCLTRGQYSDSDANN